MEEQIFLMGSHDINWENIRFVRRTSTESESMAFIVCFSSEKFATYRQSSPEGEALHNHWEKHAPKSTGGEKIRPTV